MSAGPRIVGRSPHKTSWLFQTALLSLLFWTSSSLRAEEFELLFGSRILDECLFCDRAPIERPLHGTFDLELSESPPGEVIYAVENVDLSSPDGDYTVTGSGTYRLSFAQTTTASAELDVAVAGRDRVRLTAAEHDAAAEFPAIELVLGEEEPGDELHVITITLIAAPRAKRTTRYEVIKDSAFVDDCLICGRPTIEIPVRGSFVLGEIDVGARPEGLYRIDELELDPEEGSTGPHITGGGIYTHGGEVALLQSMRLRIQPTDGFLSLLVSRRAPPEAAFPEIRIATDEHVDPVTPIHVYSLRLVATPATTTEPFFRRGDSNADGKLDVSDAVYSLRWLFASSGNAPPCLDAADTNDDGAIDITDPIFGLLYLFVEGSPPPPPGPELCGTDPTPAPALGCESFPPCEENL